MGRARRNGIAVPRQATRADGALPEARFQTRVETLAQFYGWRVYHTHDSRRSQSGFPDLCMVRVDEVRAELVFAELKVPPPRGDRGKWLARNLRQDQRAWLADLQAVGLAVDAQRVAAAALAIAGVPPFPTIEGYLWCWPADYDTLHDRLARGRARIEPTWSPLLEDAA